MGQETECIYLSQLPSNHLEVGEMKGYVDVAGGRADLFDFSEEFRFYIRQKRPSRIVIDIRKVKGVYVAKIYIPLKDWKSK